MSVISHIELIIALCLLQKWRKCNMRSESFATNFETRNHFLKILLSVYFSVLCYKYTSIFILLSRKRLMYFSCQNCSENIFTQEFVKKYNSSTSRLLTTCVLRRISKTRSRAVQRNRYLSDMIIRRVRTLKLL